MTSPASAQHDPGLGRGACPSVHTPFVELDGALLRIRLPGGSLAAAAARELAAVASEAGAGPFELTNRANLQLRGVPVEDVPAVRDALIAIGITPSDPGADERRNVMASPTAGVDAEELVDTRPLASAIADRLGSAPARLPSPSFGVLVDGGGAVHLRGRRHDLAFGALRDVDGSVKYEVRYADVLPLVHRADEMVRMVGVADVLDVVDAAIAGHRASDALVSRRGSDLAASLEPSRPAVGVQAQRQSGRVWVGGTPMLGRLDPSTLAGLADVAAHKAASTLRVTPWRGVVLRDVADRDEATVVAACEELGLVCDPTHAANVVVACAGSLGCAAGMVDTQADARALVDRLSALPASRRPASVHVSGCEKGCARSQPAELSIVGGPGPGSYDLYVGDGAARSAERFGVGVERGLDPERAIDAVVARGSEQ